jgi:uncharacterized membrane protein
MAEEQFMQTLEHQEWLSPVEDTLQKGIKGLFRAGGATGERIKSFLHGTWLGHPLHSAVTDLPVGALTSAVIFDAGEALTGSERLGQAADAALSVGVIGAVVAAVPGITDWQEVSGRARRVGLVHAAANVVGLGLFTGSLVARRRESRGWGRFLSAAGFTVMLGGAWLGGHMVYSHQVGVERTEDQPQSA